MKKSFIFGINEKAFEVVSAQIVLMSGERLTINRIEPNIYRGLTAVRLRGVQLTGSEF